MQEEEGSDKLYDFTFIMAKMMSLFIMLLQIIVSSNDPMTVSAAVKLTRRKYRHGWLSSASDPSTQHLSSGCAVSRKQV